VLKALERGKAIRAAGLTEYGTTNWTVRMDAAAARYVIDGGDVTPSGGDTVSGDDSGSKKGDTMSWTGVTSRRLGGDAVSAEPPVEPPIEPPGKPSTDETGDCEVILRDFIDRLGDSEVLKPRFAQDDFAKPEWKETFAELVGTRGAANVTQAVDNLISYLGEPAKWESRRKWQQVLGGRNTAQVFARYFDDALDIAKRESGMQRGTRIKRERDTRKRAASHA
jgi:hypothetical protein